MMSDKKVYFDVSDPLSVRPVYAKTKKEAADKYHVPVSKLVASKYTTKTFPQLQRGEGAERIVYQNGKIRREAIPGHVPFEHPTVAVPKLQKKVDELEARLAALESQVSEG